MQDTNLLISAWSCDNSSDMSIPLMLLSSSWVPRSEVGLQSTLTRYAAVRKCGVPSLLPLAIGSH